jgi:AraC-like DNA-binding protein
MEALCIYENRKCVNYGNYSDGWPIIEVKTIVGNLEQNVTHLTMLYVMDGEIDLSYGTIDGYSLVEGNLMLFPPGIKLSIRVRDGSSTVVMFKIKNRLVLCDKYVFGQIWYNIDSTNLRHSHIEANPMLRIFMELLVENVTGPLACFRFMEIKTLELAHYLRAYYRPEQLAAFTRPLVSPNAQFMYFIWNNYRKAHNVKQFARMANCSLSAFKVKFKNVTGMAPSQWMALQKAQGVFHDISVGEKTLKEISQDYHFSSVSHLGTFCRKNFGQSPGMLRPGSRRLEKSPKQPSLVSN